MRKLIVFLIIAFTFAANISNAQWFKSRWKRMRHEIGGGLGVTNFMGELGGANKVGSQGLKDFDLKATRPALNINYRYYFLESLAAKASLTYGWVGGNDVNTTEEFRNNRNLHFRSPIVDLSAQADYFFFQKSQTGHVHNLKGVKGALNIDIGFYAFTGISVFYFNPKAKLSEIYQDTLINQGLVADNKWYSLRDLCTEGQGYYPTRKKYAPIGIAIPIGLGIRHNINKDFAVEFEYGFRKTFTDYIDDVSTSYVHPSIFEGDDALVAQHFANPSPTAGTDDPYAVSTKAGMQRGNPRNDDSYMFAYFSVHYKITSTSTGGTKRKSWNRKRPRRRR